MGCHRVTAFEKIHSVPVKSYVVRLIDNIYGVTINKLEM